MVDDTAKLVSLLRAEVNVPAGDNDRLVDKVTAAIEYVDSAIGGANVSAAVRADCIVSCAADLYNSRDARLGVMDVGDGSLELQGVKRPVAQRVAQAQRGWRTHGRAGDCMSRIISEREALMDMLTDMIGDLVAVVTIDAQEAARCRAKSRCLSTRRTSPTKAGSSSTPSGR